MHDLQDTSCWSIETTETSNEQIWLVVWNVETGISPNLTSGRDLLTILLENNGKASSGKRTGALNIRCFVVTDQVKRGNVQTEHCPTDDMLADCMTKGLQGLKFSKFRRRIMGMDPEPWKEDINNLDEFGLMKQ